MGTRECGFRKGVNVLFSPKDASREPSKRNAGKVGKIIKVFKGDDSYLVKFGKTIWDEVCAPVDELTPAPRK